MCIVCQSAMSVAAVIASVIPAVSEPPTTSIVGGRCVRAAQTRTVAGVKFICVQSGKTLRWKRVSSQRSESGSSPSSTSTTSTSSTTSTTVEPIDHRQFLDRQLDAVDFATKARSVGCTVNSWRASQS